MRPANSLSLGLLAHASSTRAAFDCGTSGSSLALRSAIGQMLVQRNGIPTAQKPVEIATYVHIIANDESVQGGYYDDDLVEREMAIMNDAFAPHNFSFKLVETDRVVNESWTMPGGSPGREDFEPEMRMALRKGGYGDLNLFFTPDLVPGGRCELPLPDPTKEDILNDGCLVRAQNDDANDPQFEKVIIHEVGHWLGLQHTFENGCEEPGDEVDDTPAEAYPVGGDQCPEKGRNTCPELPGLDPVDNYMTYVKFDCNPLKFTPGQARRMHNLWQELRAPFIKKCKE